MVKPHFSNFRIITAIILVSEYVGILWLTEFEPPHDNTNKICPVWSESLLSAWRKLGSLATHWAHSEDSDQTGRMPRLIWVFAWRTCHFVVCHEAAQFISLSEYKESNVGNLEYLRVGLTNGFSPTHRASRPSLGQLPPTPVSIIFSSGTRSMLRVI